MTVAEVSAAARRRKLQESKFQESKFQESLPRATSPFTCASAGRPGAAPARSAFSTPRPAPKGLRKASHARLSQRHAHGSHARGMFGNSGNRLCEKGGL
jgi:hypothetical protein